MDTVVPFVFENEEYTLRHGSVVIAAITSCTNTSNPSVMLGAGEPLNRGQGVVSPNFLRFKLQQILKSNIKRKLN